MAEEMASAITVRFQPFSCISRILNFPLTCIAQAAGNEVAIFQVSHTTHPYASTVPLIPDSRVLRFRRPCMHLFSRRCTLLLRFACIHHASLCDYRCNIKLIPETTTTSPNSTQAAHPIVDHRLVIFRRALIYGPFHLTRPLLNHSTKSATLKTCFASATVFFLDTAPASGAWLRK